MISCVKKLSLMMFLIFILFFAGCVDKKDDTDVGVLDLGANGSGDDGDERTINDIECVLVKAGTFTMGSPTSEAGREGDETPHTVALTKDFWISKYPITQAQYRAVTGGDPSYFSGDDNPVESVTWIQANSFAQSIGGRLPTEAQWEFAARGANLSNGYNIYSGSNNLDEVGWYKDNSGGQTHPVGRKQPNELGIYDMTGNVWEWCGDWYGKYPTGAVNPTGPNAGDRRVLRGGGCNALAQYSRIAIRYTISSDSRNYVGFRVAFPRN